MLSVVLIVLKYIGIILLALFLLILFLLLLVCFVPIVYRANGQKAGEEYDFHFRFSWFGFLLKGKADFTKEDGLSYLVKILWKEVASSNQETGQTLPTDSVKSTEHSKEEIEPISENHETKDQSVECEIEQTIAQISQDDIQPIEIQEDFFESNKEEIPHKNIADYVGNLIDFMIVTCRHFTAKLVEICDKIHQGIYKTKHILIYISDSRFKEAIRFIWKDIKKLLWHIRPRKGDIYIHFGFEDPSTTGQILGVLSILRTKMKKVLHYQSEFDQEILDLSMKCKGKLQLYILLVIGIPLLLNKNVTFLRKGPFPEEDSNL